MNKAKFLHVFNNETKFSKGFFEFLQDNQFSLSQHELFHYGKKDLSYHNFGMSRFVFAKYFSIIKHLQLLRSMFKVEKIFIHSLASPWLLLFLFLFPQLTHKVYWVIWGKDLYFYQLLEKKHFYHYIYEFFRKRVFKRIKHVVTYVRGDAELAKEWYQVEAEYHECLMYPSNLFKSHQSEQTDENQTITIQVGNSSDPSNNHIEIFQKLKPFIDKDIKIIAPLSYGNATYAKKIIELGESYFGDKFTPITSFVPYKQYIEMLNKIDVAVFAHNRQQAMGNIITLLGMGKRVYLKSNTTSFQLFKDIGIKVHDFHHQLSIDIANKRCDSNSNKVSIYFSPSNLSQQWRSIFNEESNELFEQK